MHSLNLQLAIEPGAEGEAPDQALSSLLAAAAKFEAPSRGGWRFFRGCGAGGAVCALCVQAALLSPA